MKNRSKMQDPAEVYTVDMRKELKNGNRSILSEQLQRLMKERLEKKEQTMLFLNRRGYSGFVSCRECGHVIKCPHCDVSLSVHRDGKMRCHYCGYEQTHVKICPECGSDHIGEFRAGTQQIEEIVKTVFPQARVLRMDMDTTRQKDSHEKILSAFANEEADVLVGTQMIVKGHDFPNVTLVGILSAGTSWNKLTGSMRTFRIPSLFIFTLDITLKYISVLGEICVDILTSVGLRSVGKNPDKAKSFSGVLGITFLKSSEMSEEMYASMCCRGFTGEYQMSKKYRLCLQDVLGILMMVCGICLFLYLNVNM